MTPQAKNSLDLYRGQDPAKIRTLLGYQSESVVNELKEYAHTSDIGELALRLSLGFFKEV